MTSYRDYGLREIKIVDGDRGGATERWKYGHRMRTDPKVCTAAGNLKNGQIDKLIAEAAKRGYTISRREIKYRLQAARIYLTEAEWCKALAQYGTWWGLIEARFPAVEPPPEDSPEAEPYDPRSSADKLREATDQLDKELKTVARRAMGQLVLGGEEFWPADTFGPRSTLAELLEHCDEMQALHDRHGRRNADRTRFLAQLIDAVDGNLDATWQEASDALNSGEQ